jgi:hypothetical protein
LPSVDSNEWVDEDQALVPFGDGGYNRQ